jgi:glycosyltransferase involved in cell wall biosynthesis
VALRAFRPRRLVVEVQGDWRASSRLYGGRLRHALAPLLDWVAEWALEGADRVRVISTALETRVRQSGYRGEIDRFVTFSDFSLFVDAPLRPMPGEPRVAFVGALEDVKGVDLLLQAWSSVIDRVPGAVLSIAGEGSRLVQAPGVEVLGRLTPLQVRELLDESRVLVLPSRSEGLGRVVLEAMARGRAVVATAVGGVPELISDVLVPPEDVTALADGIVHALGAAEVLGAVNRRLAEKRDPAREFEEGVARLAAWLS